MPVKKIELIQSEMSSVKKRNSSPSREISFHEKNVFPPRQSSLLNRSLLQSRNAKINDLLQKKPLAAAPLSTAKSGASFKKIYSLNEVFVPSKKASPRVIPPPNEEKKSATIPSRPYFLGDLARIFTSNSKKEVKIRPLPTPSSTLSPSLSDNSSIKPRSLGDLEKIIPYQKKNSSSPRSLNNNLSSSDKTKEASRSVQSRQLGDLNHLLNRQFKNQTYPRKLGDLNQYTQSSSRSSYNQFFAPQKTNPLSSVSRSETQFPQAQKKSSSNFFIFKNLSFITLGIFGLGALVFGFNQFIKNANLNFAAQDETILTSPISPNRILTFQGRLSDFSQNSVTDTLAMTFSFYNTSGGNTPPPIGGDQLWTSNLCYVTPNSQGVFSVNLGAGTGDNSDEVDCGSTIGNIFAENSDLWLQITVAEEILFPRQLIKSVPYALNSETLQGFPASQSATANTIPVLDNQGNLNFNTSQTNLTNFGSLGLVSQTGDIYLLPGAGTVYLGNASSSANLNLSGNATISGSLVIGDQENQIQLAIENGQFVFKTKSGQNLWQDQLVLIKIDDYSQQLSLNQTSLNFNLLDGPALNNFSITENGYAEAGPSRVSAPSSGLVVNVLSQDEGNLLAATYQYAYSFVTASGQETPLSPTTVFNNALSEKPFLITNIITYNLPNIVARKIYRTKANGDIFYLTQTLNDNLSTSFIDNTADDDLHLLAPSSSNPTGVYKYKVAFVTDEAQTNPSSQTAQIVLTGDQRSLKLENIPLSSTNDVRSRKIYRSLAGSNNYYLLTTLEDNSTTTYIDNISDTLLYQNISMPSSGGIFVNRNLALQLENNGSLTTTAALNVGGRLETKHGDNQGLQLPTTTGKPSIALGQKAGDIVYDTANQIVYVYDGNDFTALNQTVNYSANSSYCSGDLCRFTLDPEYPNATLTGENDNNLGAINSGYDLINNQYRFNYYRWLSSQTTQLDGLQVNLNLTLPYNLQSFQENALSLDFSTASLDNTENSVSLSIFKSGSNLSFSKESQVSSTAGQWSSHALASQPLTITASDLAGLSLVGGDQITLQIILRSKNNQAVKVGQLNLNYLGSSDNSSTSLWRQVAGAIFPANLGQDVIFGGDSTASAKIAFLNLGNFGTPTLYLKGNLFLDSLTKKNFLDLAHNTSFGIRTLDENSQTEERLTVSPEGNIGVNVSTPGAKLDVGGDMNLDGSLRFQPMTVTEVGLCTSGNSGKIYYNSSDWQFYACQATDDSGVTFAWVKLKQ